MLVLAAGEESIRRRNNKKQHEAATVQHITKAPVNVYNDLGQCNTLANIGATTPLAERPSCRCSVLGECNKNVCVQYVAFFEATGQPIFPAIVIRYTHLQELW